MADGPTPFFIAACSVGIKKPGHHTRLHAQMSLSIGSQSTSKRAAIPIPQTLPVRAWFKTVSRQSKLFSGIQGAMSS